MINYFIQGMASSDAALKVASMMSLHAMWASVIFVLLFLITEDLASGKRADVFRDLVVNLKFFRKMLKIVGLFFLLLTGIYLIVALHI